MSAAVGLSKREILGLVLLAYARGSAGAPWWVGYDASTPEPNDGFITDGAARLNVENKLVPRFVPEVLSEILATHDKYAERGKAYGGGRVLMILANAGDGRLVRISALRDAIDGGSPFDRVILSHAV